MYYNIANRVITPTLTDNYNLVSDVTSEIQTSLNEAAGIGIKAVKPELNQDRIDGIINRISSEDNYDDVSWILDEPVKNFSQSIVDDSVKANAEFHAKAGLQPKIVRKLAGNCCKWCSILAGTYTYPNVPKDVYRRHERCRCTVNYIPINGKVQNVWTKEWREENEVLEKRKQIGLSYLNDGLNKIRPSGKIKTDERFEIHPDKIDKFLLKPGAKHANEFFDVGYTVDDYERLFDDIANEFDMNKAIYSSKLQGNSQSFSIFMNLGVTEKKRFRTVWRIDTPGAKPRLITGHRE